MPKHCEFQWQIRSLPQAKPGEAPRDLAAFAEKSLLPKMKQVTHEAAIATLRATEGLAERVAELRAAADAAKELPPPGPRDELVAYFDAADGRTADPERWVGWLWPLSGTDLEATRRHVRAWTGWIGRRSWPVRLLTSGLGALLVGVMMWASVRLSFGIDLIAEARKWLTTR